LTGLAFLSPNLLGFLFFFAGPLLFSLIVSFYDWQTTGTGRTFVGLDNYIEALSLDFASASRRVPTPASKALSPGYQVLMHLDWFGQNWLIGARDVTFWLSLRNIMPSSSRSPCRSPCCPRSACRASSPRSCHGHEDLPGGLLRPVGRRGDRRGDHLGAAVPVARSAGSTT
jgi:hypothetical protein